MSVTPLRPVIEGRVIPMPGTEHHWTKDPVTGQAIPPQAMSDSMVITKVQEKPRIPAWVRSVAIGVLVVDAVLLGGVFLTHLPSPSLPSGGGGDTVSSVLGCGTGDAACGPGEPYREPKKGLEP